MTNNHHQWSDIEPKITGLWREALLSLTSISADCFNGRHQACPSCGGRDRFRYTDNAANLKDGRSCDGGAICNQCGSGNGMYWLMKLTGMDFSTAVNELGRFVNAIPVQRREAIRKEIKLMHDTGYGAHLPTDKVNAFMNRCVEHQTQPYSLASGIAPDNLMVMEKIVNGELVDSRICIPIGNISNLPAQESEPEISLCNVAMIGNNGSVAYLAGKDEHHVNGSLTFGAVSVIGKNTGKAIYLCVDWADAWHTHYSTGAQVWCCWRSSNLDSVARKYKNECKSGKLRIACNVDFDDLCEAEKNQCQVILPDGKDKISEARKFIKAVFNPAKAIDDLFVQNFGEMAVRRG